MNRKKRSFDIVGNIAIIEVPPGLSKKAKTIATAIIENNRHIREVVRKEGGHEGKYRLQKHRHIAGEKLKETLHRENGIMLKLDINKVYFSPRQATERMRIARQVKKGENILVMFSGCAPYALTIAKNSPASTITGIEANPTAHRYALENAALNKAGNVTLIKGDARKAAANMKEKYDRIIMPLPKGAEPYLPVALARIKNNGTIHYYSFSREEEIPEAPEEKIIAACRKKGVKCRILRTVKCGQLAPRAYRTCTDFKVSTKK